MDTFLMKMTTEDEQGMLISDRTLTKTNHYQHIIEDQLTSSDNLKAQLLEKEELANHIFEQLYNTLKDRDDSTVATGALLITHHYPDTTEDQLVDIRILKAQLMEKEELIDHMFEQLYNTVKDCDEPIRETCSLAQR